MDAVSLAVRSEAGDAATTTVTDVLVRGLRELRFDRAFGLLGGAALPLFTSMVRGQIEPTHFRHEAGAAFAALEHGLAGPTRALVFTTTGPGLCNTLTAVAAARRDGGHLLVVSAATGASTRGRHAFQETDLQSLGNRGLFSDGGWFDLAALVEDPAQLPALLARLDEGLSRPAGFAAHLCLPLPVQHARLRASAPPVRAAAILGPDRNFLEGLASDLQRGRTAVWVGFGARHAAPQLRELVDRVDAVVMCTPRGKGIFPESDPRFLGVTGLGGDPTLLPRLATLAPARTLVLGTRMGEMSSFWDRSLVHGRPIHVDIDPTVLGAAYPELPWVGVQAEVGAMLDGLLARTPRDGSRSRPWPGRPAEPILAARDGGRVRPQVLMCAIQRIAVERHDAMVMTEAGNAFVWGSTALRFDRPHRYRTSMGFGSMGHFTAGVVGAALARRASTVAIVGDGAMLMHNEVSTAVGLRAPAIWIVLNDGRYGLVEDGMRGLGHEPMGLDFPPVDFAAMALAQGARGLKVEHESDVDAALSDALTGPGPAVVDVRIDPTVPAPSGGRVASLRRQEDH